MNLLNILKKKTKKKTTTPNTQKLEKNQLEKVIGGNGGLTVDETTSKFKRQIETTENEK